MTHSRNHFLSCLCGLFIVPSLCFAQVAPDAGTSAAQPPTPVKGGALPEAPVEESEPDVGQLVWLELASSLIRQTYPDHPQIVERAIESARAAIAQEFRDQPEARTRARVALQIALMSSAPRLGLKEFESLEADPGTLSAEQLRRMRLPAAGCYLSEGNRDAAEKQLEMVIQDASVTNSEAALAWALRAMTSQDRSKSLESIERTMALLPQESNEGAEFLARMARLRWVETDSKRAELARQTDEWARQMRDDRKGAILSIAASAFLLESGAERDRVAKAAASRLKGATAPDPRQRLADLVLAAAAIQKQAPELQLEIALEAEGFARRVFGERTEELRIARLLHAKVLRDAGRTGVLAEFGDLDVSEVLNPSFTIRITLDADKPVPVIESRVTSEKAR